jgi:hypothetical protein
MLMRDREAKRPMPLEESVQWKPLRDSHYVVASLQPNDGGRRKLFVRQAALARAEGLSRATHGRRAFGLLIGQFYQCPLTHSHYLVVESLAEEQHTVGDDELAHGVQHALSQASDSKTAHVLGWFCSAPRVEAKLSGGIAAIHTSYFPQPWQPVLLLADGSNAPNGAFFLHDSANSRWFYAPFHELPDHPPTGQEAKATCVAWPEYMTVDSVVLVNRQSVTPPRSVADVPTAPAEDRPTQGRSSHTDSGLPSAPMVESTDSGWAAPSPRLGPPYRAAPGGSTEKFGESRQDLADMPPQRVPETPPHGSVAKPRAKPATRLSDSSVEKIPTVDDRDRRRGSPARAAGRVSDEEDTVSSDAPARYVELARSEGFFIAAKFDTMGDAGQGETLWVLNEPYSGLLLTVASTDADVLDASLHYNLHTDDAGLRRTPFPEHRDPDSRTIYVREWCVDGLRARCRRLRATNALVREWKVSPEMSFLTPGEWQLAAFDDEDARIVQSLNNSRIAALPEGVRRQFGLSAPDEGSA